MTSKIFTEYVQNLDSKMSNQGWKIALVVDNCAAQKDIANLKALMLVFLSHNTISITQSMDQGVIKILRSITENRLCRKRSVPYTRTLTSMWASLILYERWRVCGQLLLVTVTIWNCCRHAGFQKAKTVMKESADAQGGRWWWHSFPSLSIMESKVSRHEYLNIYRELLATEEVTDELIFNNLIEAR